MTLELPKIMYGRYRDVRPRLMRIARRMRRGEEWIPLVEEHGFLDVASTPGYIVDNGPSSLLGAKEHFQLWLLWMLAREGGMRDIRDIADDIFRQSLTRPWALLGLVMSYNHLWLYEDYRHHPFLRAVVPVWDDFIAVGPRYSGGLSGEELWKGANTVVYVLANQGIEAARLHGRMTASDIAGFMRELGIALTDMAGDARAASSQGTNR